MSSASKERGSALLTALAATAVLLPLVAFATLLTRMDFYVHDNIRAGAEAFYTAEAGLEHALAEIPPAVTFAHLAYGPDGQAGTSDDGQFPFREGTPSFFPRPPLRYSVRVELARRGLLRIESTGYGVRNARAQIEVLLAHDPAPFVPAAIYVPAAGGFTVGPGFLLSGFDHAPGDPPERPSGTAPAVPALATASEAAAEQLRQQLGPGEIGQVVGSGAPPSIADVAALDVTALAEMLATSSAAVLLPTSTLSPTANLGTSSEPQITVLTDGGELAGNVAGAGVMIAPAGLRVSGQLNFSGLLLVLGDVVFARDSVVRVDGSIWIGVAEALVSLEGEGAVTYDRQMLGAADDRYTDYLPHAAIVASWRQVL